MDKNRHHPCPDIELYYDRLVEFFSSQKKEKIQIIKEHTQRFVRAVYADILRENGFVSFGGEDLSWYRISNKQVMHSVYFFARDLHFPVTPNVAYGIHPLYQEAPLPVKPYITMFPSGSWEIGMDGHLGVFVGESGVYSQDILVRCNYTDFGRKGLYDILQKFEAASDLRSCYEYHKACYEQDNLMHAISLTVISEAIYFDDKALYPLCLKRLDEMIETCRDAKLRLVKQNEPLVQECRNAILNDREAYLRLLSSREQAFIKKLAKAGIPLG